MDYLGLWSHSCGSGQHLWHGSTLEEAATAWRELTAKRDEEVDLTSWGRGTVATHHEMAWKFGTPKCSFACPICGQETPHEHSAEAISLHRHSEAVTQREMEKRWQEIESRIAALAKASA